MKRIGDWLLDVHAERLTITLAIDLALIAAAVAAWFWNRAGEAVEARLADIGGNE